MFNNLVPESRCYRAALSMLFFCMVSNLAKAQFVPATGGMYYTAGNIAIGTTNLGLARLTVIAGAQNDGIWTSGTGTANLAFLNNMTSGAWNALSQPGDNMILWKGSAPDNANSGGLVLGPWSSAVSGAGMRITYTGNVLIGKYSQANTAYKLDVSGPARADKIVVNTTGADFVFDSAYALSPLSQVETYIRQNHHLPDIAPAAQMQQEGLDVGANQTRLLQKIEELTLYVIELNKKNELLQKKVEKLEARSASR